MLRRQSPPPGVSIWREVSLDALDATKLGKYYSKVFCEEVMWVMEQAGMVLATNITADDAVAAEDVMTMTDATEVLNDFLSPANPPRHLSMLR